MNKLTVTFDPDDEVLIARALRTGEPPMVALAVGFAAGRFMLRIEKGGAMKERDGKLYITLAKPARAFDRIVIRSLLQRICDTTGKEVFASYFPNPSGAGCPDVIFVSN